MTKRLLLLLCLACTLCASLRAAEKQTFTFDVAGGDTLRLDLYRPTNVDKPTPAVIFAFGGAFMRGNRDSEQYLPFFHFLADNGVAVISTDYRTLLAKADPADLADAEEFAGALSGAVQGAVTDFVHATLFTLGHAPVWNIEPTQIFACGSSAGAITVLQAEYQNCRGAAPIIPGGFNYAGVISFAGAIFSDGTPRWRRNPAPLMLFHGDADSNVPYNQATMGGYGLYGSKSIAKSIENLKTPYTFWTVLGADHAIATTPMTQHCGAVLDFIHAVCQGRAGITTVEQKALEQAPYRTDFTILDYIKANL